MNYPVVPIHHKHKTSKCLSHRPLNYNNHQPNLQTLHSLLQPQMRLPLHQRRLPLTKPQIQLSRQSSELRSCIISEGRSVLACRKADVELEDQLCERGAEDLQGEWLADAIVRAYGSVSYEGVKVMKGERRRE